MIEEIKNCSNCSPKPNKMISAYFNEGLTNCVYCGRLLSSTQSELQIKQSILKAIMKNKPLEDDPAIAKTNWDKGYLAGGHRKLQEFESVIKEVLK